MLHTSLNHRVSLDTPFPHVTRSSNSPEILYHPIPRVPEVYCCREHNHRHSGHALPFHQTHTQGAMPCSLWCHIDCAAYLVAPFFSAAVSPNNTQLMQHHGSTLCPAAPPLMLADTSTHLPSGTNSPQGHALIDPTASLVGVTVCHISTQHSPHSPVPTLQTKMRTALSHLCLESIHLCNMNQI